MSSGPAEDRMGREPNFEAILHVPSTHRLLPVRSRSRGGILRAVYWEHEEYDSTGCLVARYECFDERDEKGVRCSGWRKYALDGSLIQEGTWPA